MFGFKVASLWSFTNDPTAPVNVPVGGTIVIGIMITIRGFVIFITGLACVNRF